MENLNHIKDEFVKILESKIKELEKAKEQNIIANNSIVAIDNEIKEFKQELERVNNQEGYFWEKVLNNLLMFNKLPE